LLERDTALMELDRLQREASRGNGHMVLLRGEAGVGKTSVIARFLAGLNRRTRVLRGWCDPLSAPRPMGPLIDMLADAPGQFATGLRAAVDIGDIDAIYAQLAGMSLGADSPSVCVVEDAHWADGATLDLLRFLARRIGSLPTLLVVSYRDDEIGHDHPLATLLGDLATATTITRIGLKPLSAAAVAELAAGSAVNAQALFQLTGGNPFYVTEVLAANSATGDPDRLPCSVSEAVWGRLARLSVVGRETAYVIAVCGPRAGVDLITSVYPGAAKGLSECMDAGILLADANAVGFRHELARRATLDRIPAYRRRDLHQQAMTVLAEPPIDQDDLSALVFHAEQAEDFDAVVRYGPAAADRASSLGAKREAAKLYALTLRHANDISDEQRVNWLERYADCSHFSGLHDAAIDAYREAAVLRRDLGDRVGEGNDLRLLSYILWLSGRGSEARDAGRASLQLLENGGPSHVLAWSLANMAEMSAGIYDPQCVEYAGRAEAVGLELGDEAVVQYARCLDALANVQRNDTGWERLEEAWRNIAASSESVARAGAVAASLCWFAALHHQLQRAEAYISETSVFFDANDLRVFQPFATGAAGLVALHRGQWTEAAACAHDVLTRPPGVGMHRILPLVTTALIDARRGKPADELLDQALAAAEPGDVFRLGVVWAARAEAAWLAGDDARCRAEAGAGLAAASQHADAWLVGHLRRWAHLAGGECADAPTPDDVTPYRLEVGGHWQAAAEEWTSLGCPYDAGIARLGGDATAVTVALETFKQLGARAAADRAKQRLAQLRGRTPDSRRKATIADPHGLTKRERDVLELVAGGHSDAEIAAALYISPKTANRHVGTILAKLGVRNRTQAAVYAHQAITLQPISPG
jgi:DNA-binding CsgD family transcriptional regulator